MARLRSAEPLLRPLLLLIMLLRPMAQAEAAARKDSGADPAPRGFGAPSLKAAPGLQPAQDPEGKSLHSELITSLYRRDRGDANSSALTAFRAPEDATDDPPPNRDPTASSPESRSTSQILDAESKGPTLRSSAEALVQTSVETMASSSASPQDANQEETDGEQPEGELGESATTTTEAPPAGGFDLESNLRAVIERIFKEALPLVYRFSTGAGSSPDCMGALFKWVLAIRRLEPWALRMVDAMGRPPAGIFEGTITDFGSFDQCLEVRAQDSWGDESFRGQYCSLFLKPNIDTSRPISFLRNSRRNLSRIMKSIWFPGFRLGICVPSACSRNDIDVLIKSAFKNYGVNASVPLCDVQRDIQLDNVQQASLICLCVVLSMVGLGTLVDVFLRSRQEKDRKPHAVLGALTSWSAYSNTLRLFDVSDDGSRLRALHGVRFLTMLWIILGYCYALTPIPNRRRIFNMFDFVKHTPFMFIANAYPAADTFFCLSGFLFGYSVFKQRRNLSKWLPILLIRRYVRVIIPCFCLLLVFSLLGLVSSGPIWRDNYALLRGNCEARWWKIPALVNNWEYSLDSCLPHLWFYAADLQLLVGFTPAVILLVRWPKAGLALTLTMVLACTVYIALQTLYSDLYPVTIYFAEDVMKSRRTHTEVFKRPFSHAGAFSLGLLLAYLLRSSGRLDAKGSPWWAGGAWRAAGWAAASGCGFAVLLGVEQWHKGLLPGPAVAALYASLHKTAWGLLVAWVAYVVCTDRKGIPARFLSWGPFVALSRLSFSAYLLHILVLFVRFGSIRERLYSSHFIQMCEFIVVTVLSYSGAYVFHLLFEAPTTQFLTMATSAVAGKLLLAEDPSTQRHATGNQVAHIGITEKPAKESNGAEGLHSQGPKSTHL
ncbi:nose resistant to fluoxetine protein 6-like isoform X2 [Rhipicephalus sanguineus]|uniref:nose resistant to fluoxetine protein 6-like isoform X2 n=1 Tax=Rhipicephalus sanguineus TaxID=34632 RepID=UPI001893D96A|nr:nose resistant to fluoxetine protein 6-like isoform X2 [Rhipicephalus sanguineus]